LEEGQDIFLPNMRDLIVETENLAGAQVKKLLPPKEIVAAIRAQNSREMFIRASRYALHYMRTHHEEESGEDFFSSLYATSMALLLGEPKLINEPGIVNDIRGWELDGDQWVKPQLENSE
jgi:hypothetical protein